MAQYRGTIQGGRGQAARLGTKKSGLYARLGSWSGGVEVNFWYDDEHERDMLVVKLIPWDNGQGARRILYDGPASGVK